MAEQTTVLDQAEEGLTTVTLRFSRPMLVEIERIMTRRIDRPRKSAVVRELVAEALEARAARASAQLTTKAAA